MAEVSRAPVNRLVKEIGVDQVGETAITLHEHLHSAEDVSCPLTFPFEWRQGDTVIAKIEKLSDGKLREIVENHNGAKENLVCAICGEQKKLGFRKESGNVSHLICEECTIRYVRNAHALTG